MHDHTDERHGHHGGRHGDGSRHGRHGGWGPGRIERGALRFVLLDALRSGPRHGYELIKEIEERTHGRYVPSAGAIYPTLQHLAHRGLIGAAEEGDRRVYSLTEAGQAKLEAIRERVEAFWAHFAEAPSPASRHEVEFLGEELEDLSRTIWNGLRETIRRDDREMIRRVRRAVEQCQEEIRTLIAGGSTNAEPPEAAV